MKIVAFGAVLGLLFAVKANSVHAVEVSWEMTGTIHENTGLEGVFVGDPFRVSVTFDSDAALITTQTGGRFEPGARYQYDTSVLTIVAGLSELPEIVFESSPENSLQLLWIRDNSGDLKDFGEPPVVIYDYVSDTVTLAARGARVTTVEEFEEAFANVSFGSSGGHQREEEYSR